MSAAEEVSVHLLGASPRRPRRVAIGTFDGVHVGHRRVIAGADTVLTFSPHPRAVIGESPALLTEIDARIDLLAGCGVSEVVLIPFDRAFAQIAPQRFIDEVLVGELGAVEVAIGSDFRFGRRGSGGVGDLRADQRFRTRVEPLLLREGDVVSSTRIRSLVEAGDVEAAARLLERKFRILCRPLPDVDPDRLSIPWPDDLVRPAPGAYSVAVLGPRGEDAGRVPGEMTIAEDGVLLLPERGIEFSGPVTIELSRRLFSEPGDIERAIRLETSPQAGCRAG